MESTATPVYTSSNELVRLGIRLRAEQDDRWKQLEQADSYRQVLLASHTGRPRRTRHGAQRESLGLPSVETPDQAQVAEYRLWVNYCELYDQHCELIQIIEEGF